MTQLKITYKDIGELQPYANNPRLNEDAVQYVAESIKQFGMKVPVVIDRNNIIVAGHTRIKACQKLGIRDIPCIIADDLTEDQVNAFRLADNKTAEFSDWDYDALGIEMENIQMDLEPFGFEVDIFERNPKEIDFSNLDRMMGEKDEDYQEFEDKFKPKYTTDDCFTPPEVYETIKKWVFEQYDIDENRKVIRPFYPGADYTKEEYPEGCIVIDNPPFSIASKIYDFYIEKGIDFFLFANHLTSLNCMNREGVNVVLADCRITYENGAIVPTSFHTNLGEARIHVSSSLHNAVEEAQPSQTATLNAYSYPENIQTASSLGRLAGYGSEFKIKKIHSIRSSDSGIGIYGSGVLISDEDAEKVKAEKVKAEKVKAEKVKAEREKIEVTLSERERVLIEELGR